MIIYITGPSGSGKTTLATKLYYFLKNSNKHVVHMDGDSLRFINDDDLGHSDQDRLLNAKRMQNLCRLLDSQGVDVVVSMMLIFDEICIENHLIFSDFFHFNLNIESENLKLRDNKNVFTDLDYKVLEMCKLQGDSNKIDLNANNSIIDNFYIILNFLKLEIKYTYDEKPVDPNVSWHKYNDYDFMGKNFLDSFIDKRNKYIIVKNLNMIDDRDQNTNYFVQNGKGKNSDYSIENHFLNILDNINDTSLERVLIFIQKFEVSKKFYSHYDSGLNKISDVECYFDCYLMFSYILYQYLNTYKLSEPKVLIIFNTLLKVNDLIIGKYYYKLSKIHTHLFSEIIRFELKKLVEII